MIEEIQKFCSEQIFTSIFIQGIIVELIGGFLFILFLLFVLRPKFEISPVIVKYVDSATGRDKYSVKVVNKSFFSAVDLEVSLGYYSLQPSANTKPHKDYKTIPLIISTYSYIPNRLNKNNEFAVWFSTYEPIENIIKPPNNVQTNNTVLFRIIMKHGLTGLTGAKEQEYTAMSQIKENSSFKSGNTFETEII